MEPALNVRIYRHASAHARTILMKYAGSNKQYSNTTKAVEGSDSFYYHGNSTFVYIVCIIFSFVHEKPSFFWSVLLSLIIVYKDGLEGCSWRTTRNRSASLRLFLKFITADPQHIKPTPLCSSQRWCWFLLFLFLLSDLRCI